MPDIVLTTLNAKYIHAAFGLRYLLANLGPLQPRACILEFDINQRPSDIAEVLLAQNPEIIGFGIYIWNVALAAEVVATIKRVRPDVKLILGGPEVSYELESQSIVQLADHVITGEADLKFAEVCRQLLNGETLPKLITADLPEFSQLQLPYLLYTDEDIAHRVLYVEASRGCPFTCEFCLSSLDIPVRQAPLASFLDQLQQLLDRGARHFKFVDRTFNLNITSSKAILEFLLKRYQPGHFYHFEMIPDRLPELLRELIAKFPSGALQFEVGIQTFNQEVGELIKRRQNYERLENNFRFLRANTGVHIHADLIVGLPGETLDSFGSGFDRLIALGPQEIQVGILKRLRGTPIVRHDVEWQMVYNPHPPYEILQTKLIDFATMQKLRRFARYWDLIGNSGNFVQACPLIFHRGIASSPTVGKGAAIESSDVSDDRPGSSPSPPLEDRAGERRPFTRGCLNPTVVQGRGEEARTFSPFQSFMHFSEWLFARVGRTDSIALVRLMEFLFTYLTRELSLNPKSVANALWHDYKTGGRNDRPAFLKDHLPEDMSLSRRHLKKPSLPKRQFRHARLEA